MLDDKTRWNFAFFTAEIHFLCPLLDIRLSAIEHEETPPSQIKRREELVGAVIKYKKCTEKQPLGAALRFSGAVDNVGNVIRKLKRSRKSFM